MIKNVTIGNTTTDVLIAPDGQLYTVSSLYFCNHSDSDETLTVYACARNESASDTNTIIKELTIPAETTFKIGIDKDIRYGKIRDQKLLVQNLESIKAKVNTANSRITATASFSKAFINTFNNSQAAITLNKACDLSFSDVDLLIQSDTRFQDDPIIDSSEQKTPIEIKGNVHHSVSSAKFGASSLIFDGASNLQVPINSRFYDSTTFTFECWFNTSSSDNQWILTANGNQHYFGISINPGASIDQINLGGNGPTPSPKLSSGANATISLNKWYHLAYVKDNLDKAELYFDGNLIASTDSFGAGSYTGFDHTSYMSIGAQDYNEETNPNISQPAPRQHFKGYLEDIRISHVRRYNP